MVDQAERKDSQAYLALCLHHQVGSIVLKLFASTRGTNYFSLPGINSFLMRFSYKMGSGGNIRWV